MNVYLLTPTGNRPEGLALLAEYINGQTYAGPLTWVIVDDCDPATRIPRPRDRSINVELIRPDWRWQPGQNTQARSLLAGLEAIPQDAKVLVLEDDDAYLPNHVANMVEALDNVAMAGERVARYYNVSTGRCRVLPVGAHAALAATGVQGRGLQALVAACRASEQRIDVRCWRGFNGPKQLLDTANVIGIKGLPGRAGIGVGHRASFGTPDDGTVLRQWLGNLADNYAIFRKAA